MTTRLWIRKHQFWGAPLRDANRSQGVAPSSAALLCSRAGIKPNIPRLLTVHSVGAIGGLGVAQTQELRVQVGITTLQAADRDQRLWQATSPHSFHSCYVVFLLCRRGEEERALRVFTQSLAALHARPAMLATALPQSYDGLKLTFLGRAREDAMKTIASIVILMSVSGSALAQQNPVQTVTADRLGTWAPRDTNSCDTIFGDGRQLCLADRYRMHLEQQAQAEQTAVQRAQTENLLLNNELLRHELAHVQAAAAAPSATELSAIPGFAIWQTENRWFGSDRPRTEYALLYAKDLRQEQPELTGRPFLNALSARVRDVFASPKR